MDNSQNRLKIYRYLQFNLSPLYFAIYLCFFFLFFLFSKKLALYKLGYILVTVTGVNNIYCACFFLFYQGSHAGSKPTLWIIEKSCSRNKDNFSSRNYIICVTFDTSLYIPTIYNWTESPPFMQQDPIFMTIFAPIFFAY